MVSYFVKIFTVRKSFSCALGENGAKEGERNSININNTNAFIYI